METFVKPSIMLVLVINAYLLMIVQGDKEYLSNYTDAKMSCHNRGGIISRNMLKFDGLINMTAELCVNDGVLNDGESVWVQGRAQTGPYITLHICMRLNNQDFARKNTFYSNILYECSVFCDKILHSMGYIGIFKDSCFCMYSSFIFPRTSECLLNDFMDIHKRVIVFSLIGDQMQFDVRYKSSDYNCLGAWFREDAPIAYFNTTCVSYLHGICTERVDSDLSSNCQPKMGGFCFPPERYTFLEHYRQCWLYGTLMPFISRLGSSFSYVVMLGSFRAFKAIEDDGDEKENVNWSCLSMTQFNGIIYLETEHCSNGNAFVCMDDIDNISKMSESEIKNDSYTDTFKKSGSETKDDSKTNVLNKSGSETKVDSNTRVFNTSGSETKDNSNTRVFNTSGSETKDDSTTNIRHFFIIICTILVSVVILLALSHVWSLYRRHINNRPRDNDGASRNDMYITAITDERSVNDATQVVESAVYDEAEGTGVYHEII